MARVLYAWEIGDHNGHVVPYLPLLCALRARGHHVTVVARDTGEVGARVHAAGLSLLQAPVCLKTFGGIAHASIDYPEILQHVGYAHVPTLTGLALGWEALFDTLAPDLVLANNAPWALRVAALRGLPAVRLGSGFNCPPAGDPMPVLRPGAETEFARRHAADARIVATVNSVAATLGQPGIERVRDFFSHCETWLFTFAELDHYGARPGASYLGLPAFMPAQSRVSPYAAPEVFAYLRMDHPHTELLLATLAKLDRVALACVPDIDDERLRRFSTPRVRITREPVNARETLADARVVVNHAGHNLTAESLLSGVPVLAMPGHLEQYLVARNVERLGAGLHAPFEARHPKLHAALGRLLDEPGFRARALAFAAANRPSSADGFLDTLCNECARLAAHANPLLKRKTA